MKTKHFKCPVCNNKKQKEPLAYYDPYRAELICCYCYCVLWTGLATKDKYGRDLRILEDR